MKNTKLLLIVMLTVLSSFVITSCYPDYGLGIEDFDIVFTFNDNTADFQAYRTFYLPDTLERIGSGGELEPNEGENDQLILDEIANQMIGYGYTRVTNPDTADVKLFAGVSSSTTFTYYPGWWGGYYGWYYPYYPYYGGGYSYSYTTGSLFVSMVDDDLFNPSTLNTGTIWAGILNGVLDNTTPAELRVRVVNSIAQMFEQSPYLKIYE